MLPKSDFAAALGLRIRWLREKKEITQRDLAQRVGYSQTMITMIEMGVREPTLEKTVKLAYVLGCSTDYLLGRKVAK